MAAKQSANIDLILEKVDTIGKLITGNGSPEKGIIVRLDRIETKIHRADWIVKTLFFVVATGVCSLVIKEIVRSL